MGISSSCEYKNLATAKLILDDGRLQEFSYPVKVSQVLHMVNPAYFICNSDELDFDDVVSAVSDDEDLQLGQLYFALPLNRLNRRLKAEDMAALAVKASSALTNSCGDKYCLGAWELSADSGRKPSRKVAEGGGAGKNRNCGRRSSGWDGRRGKFTARLGAIPE